MTDNDRLRRADRLIWTFIAVVAAIVVTACVAGTFHLAWTSFAKVALASLLLGLASLFYSFRKEERIASGLQCTAQFVLFPSVAAPLSYIAASAALPLWDKTYASWDRGLGLDWMGWLAAMNNHPMLHEIFAQAYSSFLPQAAIVIIALALTGHLLHLRLYILSFIFAALVTIAISAALPAEGVWGYFKLSPSDYPNITPVTQDLHLKIFHGLRDDSFRELVAQGAEGIITFPSLHTAGGWLFIFAMWPVRYLRWPFLLLNITMIVATPVDGGHYFSDVIAGTATAVLCWMATARMIHGSAASAEEIAFLAVAPSIEPDLNPLLPEIAAAHSAETRPAPIAQA